jgi:hypothetical protein
MRNQICRAMLAILIPALMLLGTSLPPARAFACTPMQPYPGPSVITESDDGLTTFISTAPAIFPESDTFGPEPSNLLPTVYENVCDSNGDAIPNTLPSTREHPYNLHPDPQVSPIDKTSPTDDIRAVLDHLKEALQEHHAVDTERVQFAIDVLEGNPVDRAYSGMPLLHYNGPNKLRVVDDGTRTVEIHQVWYDSHIESDTSYVDPSAVQDEEWAIRYVVDVLNRAHEDFAPYAMFFDDPQDVDGRLPNVGMDQTFFPMEEGQRYVFEMKMPPARFWNLTYHWGWRVHPPRVQVTENVLVPLAGMPRNTFEIQVFGEDPSAGEEAKLAAIDMLGDLAPAKRMWRTFRAIKQDPAPWRLKHLVDEASSAFDDWQNRNKLPSGVQEDPDADVTILYVNNTLYGHVKGYVRDTQMAMIKWRRRGDKVKVKLLNADYYPHTYVLVDFGGLRGWENIFHNTLPVGGAGPWFTFGRNHFWIHTSDGPVMVPPAERPSHGHGRVVHMADLPIPEKKLKGTPRWLEYPSHRVAHNHSGAELGEHNVVVTFNYEPSPRLRMYQFDAFHHDVAVWSIH